MHTNLKILIAYFLSALLAAVIPSAVFAGEPSVNFLIDVMEASDQPGSIDPGLAYIREQIQRSPFRYQRYRTLASTSRTIPVGKRDVIGFVVPEEFTLEITPASAGDRTIRISLRIWQKRKVILDTNLDLTRGGTVVIGGPATSHSAIMFAISEGL